MPAVNRLRFAVKSRRKIACPAICRSWNCLGRTTSLRITIFELRERMSRIRIRVLVWVTFAAVALFAKPQAGGFESTIKDAVRLQEAGDYVAAARAYRDALKLKPDDV